MKRIIVALVIVVLIIVGWLAFSGKNDTTKTNSTTANNNTAQPTNNQTNQSNQTSAQPVSTNQVEIKDMAFKPSDITVKKGTTVTWTNKDSVSHTVTQDNSGGPGLDSKVLTPGESYQATFSQTGTFKYHCSIHPQMTGSVTVTE